MADHDWKCIDERLCIVCGTNPRVSGMDFVDFDEFHETVCITVCQECDEKTSQEEIDKLVQAIRWKCLKELRGEIK